MSTTDEASFTMSVSQAAKALDITPQAIRNRIDGGDLPAVRRQKGERYFFWLRPADVEALGQRMAQRREEKIAAGRRA